MPVLTVPAPLRQRLGEEATDNLVALINAADDSVGDNVIKIAEERFERRLAQEIGAVEVRLNERLGQVEVRLSERMNQIEARLDKRITEEVAGLRVELARNRSDLIRWMFAFWIGQTAVIVALFTLLRSRP
ncbi:MAG: DUF1640 domain-containing protein [Chloroflexi bacterium]|nr:DUF1640 domain-containing protein [Chloroflexota bacterium]MBI3762998.1 DUF1640 domain-containing protein [Chloroflexota bacterium]